MSQHAYIARQPIVDTEHRLIAYELLFRRSAAAETAEVETDLDAGVSIITNTLCNMGTDWLLKGKLAFINMETPMLQSSFSTLLPGPHVVFEVLETVQTNPEVLERLRELKAEGFRIALDDFHYFPESEPLLPLADFVKFDLQHNSLEELAGKVARLKRHPLKLVAEKVESQAQFEACRKLGFDYFQGYYFARPENLSTRVINPSQSTVLQLMARVRAGAELAELEALFKHDVALTFKLLRYINSVGFGLSCEVHSIRHAVSLVGLQPMYRWLTLLLVTAGTHPSAPVLARMAITRGRFCELAGQEAMPGGDADSLFLSGVFSLLPAMLEMNMNEVLERVAVPEAVADALRDHGGIYGPFLALAEAMESGEHAAMESKTLALMLTPKQVSTAHMRALAWVEQLGID
ncbi:MAG: EAL domain-containing protein [Betaproteobacteria bacterium]|nr:EAL domain-containing protein [Betaproteobacteria bacterium]